MNSLVVFLTFKCNYHCPYCTFRVERTDLTALSDIDVHHWLDFARSFEDETLWDLTGGEPTLHPGFRQFVEGIPEHHKVAVTTNLSYSVGRIKELFSHSSFVHVTCSYHPSAPTDLAEFISKMYVLRDLVKHVSVNYVAIPGEIEKIGPIADVFRAHNIPFHVDPYRGPKYQFSELDFYLLSRFLTDRPFRHNPPPALCPAGFRYFVCRADGNVYRCSAGMFADQTCLGNIAEGTFRRLDKPTPCPFTACENGCDIDGIKKVSQ